MNAERLLAHYERIADAPDAIARLRRFILDLVVRGKLVQQDANDEPASDLLKRIAKERAERISRGEMRREKQSADPVDFPFEPPTGWVWLRLGETGNISSGNSINEPTREQLSRVKNGRPFIATKDVGYGLDRIVYDNGLLVEFSDERFRITQKNSVLICAEGGSAGKKIGLADREICFGNKLLANETWSVIAPKFVLFVYMSEFFYQQFASKMKGVIGGISIANFLELPFPLPPLVEQHRIVAKVDELMGLCDRLEAARERREAVRDRLAAASLARFNAPDPETFHADARFALAALPALTTRPDQIKRLRQTILNLAVRGKLVLQDANDEPASELLKRIARTKLELLRKKKLKGNIPITNSISIRESIEPPGTWQWASCDELFFVTKLAGFEYTKHFDLKNEGEVPVIRAQNVRPWTVEENNLKFMSLKTSLVLERSAITKPAILITFIGAGIGDVALIDTKRRWHLAPNVAKAELFEGCDSLVNLKYVVMFFNSPVGRAEIFKHIKTTAQPSLSMGTIRDMDVVMPPLAEQHRIVAKVDALMALCDRLEESLTATAATRRRLLDALLAEALAPVDTRELETAE